MRSTIKPFLKWAGGKSQLISEIDLYLPFAKGRITKYAEPFVGGGAVLCHILNNYSLSEVYISDINADLIDAYLTIRDNVDELVTYLKDFENTYKNQDFKEREKYYYLKRDRFNQLKQHIELGSKVEKSALMIFLNRTCFNGLYRVNSKGLFNVPYGKYINPKICDEENLKALSEKLAGVHIVCAPYNESESFIDEKTFVYFDPPYRPLNQTSNFTSYTENDFGDNEQIALACYFEKQSKKGALCLLSNSDPKNTNPDDDFFDDLYSNYSIRRIFATRMINSNASQRGKITEILVSNIKNKEKGNKNMYLEMDKEKLAELFEKGLLETNRGYNYYIDWTNVVDLSAYQIEICAMDTLIGCEESKFKDTFDSLVTKLPSVIEVFPFLFGLSKVERNAVRKKGELKIIGSEIDSDFRTFSFNGKLLEENCTQENLDKYYAFFVDMGLKNLFQSRLEKSTMDYIVGVLVGMDSNGRKNRGGKAFELACEPLIRKLCDKYNLDLIVQKKFKYLHTNYNWQISKDEENRKADFIIINKEHTLCMNIEVNFYNGVGSKPEEIIDAYIRRQDDLEKLKIGFVLITDGNCWRGTTNQLTKGFNYLKYLLNFNLLKNGMLEEIVKKEFKI